MARFDLAGNPLPDPDGAPPPQAAPPRSAPPRSAPPRSVPPGPAPFAETRRPTNLPPIPAPGAITLKAPPGPVPAPRAPAVPAAPLTAQAILTRGVVQETPAQKVRAYAGLIATFVVLIIATYAVAAIPSPVVPAPDSYTPYTSAEGGFACDAPWGWKQHDLDGETLFIRRKVRIEIEGQPLSDDAGGGGESAAAPGSPAPAGPSVDDLDAQNKATLAAEYDSAHLQELPTQSLALPTGEARLTEWTAKTQLTELHGCRATLVGGGEEVSVLCVCPERNWVLLKPAFLHVIQSITPTAAPATPSQTGGQ